MIVHALAYSHIRYGICCFFNCSSFWKSKVNRLLQNILKSVAYNTNIDTANLFRSLEMPNFDSVFLSVVVPRYFWNENFRVPAKKHMNLRNPSRYVVPRTRTNYGKGQRKYYIPNLFNELPTSVLEQRSLSGLKNALKKGT